MTPIFPITELSFYFPRLVEKCIDREELERKASGRGLIVELQLGTQHIAVECLSQVSFYDTFLFRIGPSSRVKVIAQSILLSTRFPDSLAFVDALTQGFQGFPFEVIRQDQTPYLISRDTQKPLEVGNLLLPQSLYRAPE